MGQKYRHVTARQAAVWPSFFANFLSDACQSKYASNAVASNITAIALCPFPLRALTQTLWPLQWAFPSCFPVLPW